MMKNISAVIVVHNHDNDAVKECVASLLAQSVPPNELVIVDNASENVDFDALRVLAPHAKIIHMGANYYFCRGVNEGFKHSTGKYILFSNPDVVYSPQYIENLIAHLVLNPNAGIVGGTILRKPISLVNRHFIVDSTGIFLDRFMRATDRDAGKVFYSERYLQCEKCVAVTGAAMLCRRSALEKILINGTDVLDEHFKMYKDDVDLGWRIVNKGMDVVYVRDAVAFHERGWKPTMNRVNVPKIKRYHSFKNQYIMLLKNATMSDMLRSILHRLTFDIAALGYVLIFERFLLKAYADLWKLRSHALTNRHAARSLRQYFSPGKKPAVELIPVRADKALVLNEET